MRYTSKLLPLAILWGLGISACATAPQPSPYRVQIPTLTARPIEYDVGAGEWIRCYRRDDALAIVIELKAACLALGGTDDDCQSHLVPPP